MYAKKIAVTVSTLLAVAGIGLAAAPAQAAEGCNTPEACLSYNSNLQGAIFVHQTSLADYAGYAFSISSYGGSAGAGQFVKNNAASVENLNLNYRYRVYYNSNYSGAYQTVGTEAWANLNSTLKNENASGAFIN
ncbi:peptidase inhibitor family I36 protein [Streptomyces sp. NPDC005134]|uniref:peptidase inhibitor family I36 protein n=1 Tax=Streptomyces sp. NPDC005098 TaxID=3154560 RepID=UPI0033B91FB7